MGNKIPQPGDKLSTYRMKGRRLRRKRKPSPISLAPRSDDISTPGQRALTVAPWEMANAPSSRNRCPRVWYGIRAQAATLAPLQNAKASVPANDKRTTDLGARSNERQQLKSAAGRCRKRTISFRGLHPFRRSMSRGPWSIEGCHTPVEAAGADQLE